MGKMQSLAEDLVLLLEYKDTEVVRRVRVGQQMVGINKKGQAVRGNPHAMHTWNANRARMNAIKSHEQTPVGREQKKAAALAAAEPPKKDWKEKFKEMAKHAGHQLAHPFVAAKDLVTKPEARKKFSKYLKGAIRKEVKETKHLKDTIKRALKGDKIYEADRRKAINQAVDLVKVALLGATVAHLFHGGVVKAIGALASPVDEVVAMGIDKPLRDVTEKVFGSSHGLLPSSFYEEAENEYDVLDRIIDQILAGIANSDFDEPV